MTMRWVVSEDGGVTYPRVVKPIGPSKFSWERDLNANQIFFRHKLASDLAFTEKADWDFFYGLDRQASKRCMELFIRREWRCGLTWKTFWTGTFSVGGGSFDLDSCIFEVRPDVVDKYSCVLSKQNNKVNILQAPPYTVTAAIVAPVEFMLCRCELNPDNYTSTGPCDELDAGGVPSPGTGWDEADTFNYDFDDSSFFFEVCFFWREKQTLPCVNNEPVAPVGSGWEIYQNNCDVDGTSTWVRVPQFTYAFGTPVNGTFDDDGNPVPPDNSCAWIYAGSVSGLGGVNLTPFFVCLSDDSDFLQTYERARKMTDAIQLLIEGCGISSTKSDFFGINPPGDAPGYATGINYVTGRPNQLLDIMFLQNTDALIPTPTNHATRGEWTFKQAMEFMASFEVFWDIEDGALRLEHWTYWTLPVGLEITNNEYASLSRNAWKPLKDEAPKLERLTFAQAQGPDFRGEDIEYSGPCVTDSDRDQISEKVVPLVSTDIAFYYGDSDAVNRQGFLALATVPAGTGYAVILDEGALSHNLATNAPISVANLERDYWLDRRFLFQGTLNGVDTTFRAIRPRIEQRPIIIRKLCCDIIGFDPRQRVSTELGERLGGVLASVQRMDFEEKGETLTIVLRYPY